MFFINSRRIIILVVGALCEIWQFNTGLCWWYEIFACSSYKNKPLYYKHSQWFCKQCLYYFIQTWLAILAILQTSTWSLCSEVQLIFIPWSKSNTRNTMTNVSLLMFPHRFKGFFSKSPERILFTLSVSLEGNFTSSCRKNNKDFKFYKNYCFKTWLTIIHIDETTSINYVWLSKTT